MCPGNTHTHTRTHTDEQIRYMAEFLPQKTKLAKTYNQCPTLAKTPTPLFQFGTADQPYQMSQ